MQRVTFKGDTFQLGELVDVLRDAGLEPAVGRGDDDARWLEVPDEQLVKANTLAAAFAPSWRRVAFETPANPAALLDELHAAGIEPVSVTAGQDGGEVIVEVAVAAAAVLAVVKAHDPQAVPASQLELEQRDDAEAALRDQAGQALQQLEAAADGWADLTAAQKDAALKLTVRTVARLARLVLRQLT